MAAGWSRKRVLITVRTYPVPAHKGIEVSCTAGVTDDGKWIRLFPVPYRFLDHDKRFTKYQWIDVDVTRPRNDQRPESYTLNAETIQTGETVMPVDHWRRRKDIILPLKRESMCQMVRELENPPAPTLGIFRPAKITRLIISPAKPPNWTPQQLVILSQTFFDFAKAPKAQLEKIPLDFRYEFRCSDAACTGHRMICTDWEMAESYRRWRGEYGANWESMFRQRYERDMIEKNDTHFYVGTLHQHPKNWIIVGLFYPPREAMADLFG